MVSPRQHILVVEGNADLQKDIVRTLRLPGFSVHTACSGDEGLAYSETIHPDLILLGGVLPDMSGLDFCLRMRESSHVPIIVMGTPGSTNVNAALTAGADDYLSLPVDEQELLARIKGILRRHLWNQSSEPVALRIDNLVINPSTQELLRDGRNIRLSKTEWALLSILVSNAGKVVTRHALLQGVWGAHWDEHESNLRVVITRLRNKLEVDPNNPTFLLTEPGIGYYFAMPPRIGDPVAANLPRQSTSFIGRDVEIAALKELLLHSDTQLVTLTGPGGSGKTRLAIQLASDLVGKFEDGIRFIPFGPISDPALLGVTILRALNLRETSDESIADQIKAYLAEKHMLMILDNFEHIIEQAPFVATMIDSAPRVKILVTSRTVLHLLREYDYKVPPLPVPDLDRLPAFEKLSTVDSVQLFVERTRAITPSFTLTPENAPTVASICARLDGLPLVIELAAARMRILSPEAILERLSSRLTLLTSGERDRPERHRTLRGVLDWSYNLLDEASRSLLAQLGILVGDYNLAAVQAICRIDKNQAGDIIDSLVSLLDNNVLQQHEVYITEHDPEFRYSMLETIREYAYERLLKSGELDTLQRRHAAYYLTFAEEAKPHLLQADQQLWLNRLDQEHRNLQLALQWALDAGEKKIALRFYAVLGHFWLIRGYQSEGRRWLAHLPQDPDCLDFPPYVEVLSWAGWLTYGQLEHDKAFQFFKQGLALSRKFGDKRNAVRALNGMGILLRGKGQDAEAVSLYEESLMIAREISDNIEIAWTLINLAMVAHKRGDHDRAINMVEESLELFREAGHFSGIAHALHTLGGLLLYQGNIEAARPLCEKGLLIHQSLGQKDGVIQCLNLLSKIALHQDRLADSQSLLEQCLQLIEDLSFKSGKAEALNNLGRVALAQGNPNEAKAYLTESGELFQSLDQKDGIAAVLESFAAFALAQHYLLQAVEFYAAADELRTTEVIPLAYLDQVMRDRHLDDLRAQLGDDSFHSAWQQGKGFQSSTLKLLD